MSGQSSRPNYQLILPIIAIVIFGSGAWSLLRHFSQTRPATIGTNKLTHLPGGDIVSIARARQIAINQARQQGRTTYSFTTSAAPPPIAP